MVAERPRLATPADLAAVENLVIASYEKYLRRVDKPPAPMERDYAEAIANQEVWILGNPVDGVISLVVVPDNALLIENIAVHPSTQGSGRGRTLMDFSERVAAARGLSRLVLYTNEVMTENLSLYMHLGFSELGRRTEDGRRRVYMEKILPTR
jgi:ribosomal protein S18 acetylase RimI-like enzyme